MTVVDVFLDTNILIYAVGATAPRKKARARDVLRNQRIGLSAQVMQEFYSVSTVKMKPPLPPIVAAAWIDRLMKKPFVPTDMSLIKQGIAMSQRYRISYWDGAIIAAAEALGAPKVYSENMNHGQRYGGVTVENPFL